jgi:hypothetical protein
MKLLLFQRIVEQSEVDFMLARTLTFFHARFELPVLDCFARLLIKARSERAYHLDIPCKSRFVDYNGQEDAT